MIRSGRLWVLILSSLILVSSMKSVAWAAEAVPAEDLRAEINMLKERLAQLEQKLSQQAAAPGTGAPASAQDMPVLKLPHMMQDVHLSGFVDTTYVSNFNAPDTRRNVGRMFDTHSNSFNINATAITLEKLASPDHRVGFRTDLLFGNDAEVIGAAGLGERGDAFDLTRAYVEMLLPAKNAIPSLNDINLKAGKFVTLMSPEVLPSIGNWNTSRGFLFAFGGPGTLTGVLGTYTFDNGWDVSLGGVNGSDVVDDLNNGKSVIGRFSFNAIPLGGDSSLTLKLSGMAGPEAASDDNSYRYVGDMVAIYQTPWKPLSFMYNYVYAYQEDLLSEHNGANWYGHAGYARLDINPAWSVSFRGEFFNDTDGQRIVAGTPAEYWSLTGTLEWRPWRNLITRLEYRYDGSDRNVFNDHNGGLLSDHQSTISGEAIVVF